MAKITRDALIAARVTPQVKAIADAEAERLGLSLADLVRVLVRLAPAIEDAGRVKLGRMDVDVLVFDVTEQFRFVTRDLQAWFLQEETFDVSSSRIRFDDLGRAEYFDVSRGMLNKDDREEEPEHE